jgi:hypothetical protein
MRSTRLRAAALVPLLMVVCLSLWTVHSAAATARNVPTEAEAWYQASPTDLGEEDPSCALPAGCLPQAGVPANPYPEDTLQVGVAAGRDTARTFVSLDLGALPDGALLTGGTLTLPVLPDSDSGSFAPATAQVSACPVSGTVEDARGGPPDEQPDFACSTAAEGTYNEGDEPTITVDLAPIATLLSTGGIAIVPSQDARDAGGSWRVAFPTRDSDAEVAITATLSYQEPPTFDAGLPGPSAADAPGGGGNPGGFGSFESDAGFEPAPGADVAPPDFGDTAPQAAGPADEQPIAAGPPVAAPVPAAAFGYAYPAVWLAPLVLAGVAGALARSLTGEIVLPEPAGEGTATSPNLVERLLAALHPPAGPQQPPTTA